ncbi:MAG: type transport system permease protein [Chloroflexota bacterium]|nr:type transport system permease protein [Chloroflexota bacterium]
MTVPQRRSVAVPTWSSSLKVLLRADSTAQVRTPLSLVITFALPLILLVATGLGKSSAALGGPEFRISLALTVGLVSIGTVGYSLAIARDRDAGVFQRLRVTPAPTWTIMVSRWIVQLGAVLVMAIVVLVVAALIVGVTLPPQDYLFTVLVALLGSAVFLSIGQAIVGLIASADTLNAAGRFLYVPLIALSVFGDSDRLGTTVEMVSRWSPGGCLETLLSAAMGTNAWSGQSWGALFASFAYTVVFGVIGIRWFRWISH